MRYGVRLGVDPGEARIGVARCDAAGILATPVETVRRGKGDLRRLARLVADAEAIEVIVGLPRSLAGRETASTGKARELAGRLAARVAPVPVRLVDERLTTVTATSILKGQRKGASQRSVVDQVAAVVILQQALESERATGLPPGELVEMSASGVSDPTSAAEESND